MIVLKNRSRETRIYQYPRDVSVGPVRPQVIKTHRGSHNPRNGEVRIAEKAVTIGGVLTLPPRSETVVPELLTKHPSLQRDIAARLVVSKPYAKPSPVPPPPKQQAEAPKTQTRTRRRSR